MRWSLLPIFSMLISCAKVGAPLPPLVRILDPVEVQLVQQAQDRIELLVQPPLDDIQEVEIYRECGNSLTEVFKGSPIARVEVAEAERNPLTGSLAVEDPEPRFDEPCRYQIRVRNEQGRRSPPSATVQTSVTLPPGPPTNLRVQVQEQQTVVSWDAPSKSLDGSENDELVGYLVNSAHVVSGTQFIDKNVVFGKPVSYWVQSIGNLEQPAILSRPSERLEVIPMDNFAPAAPQNLTAVPLDSKVQLVWDEVADSELAGYFVYRGADQVRLEKASTLVTINRYVDPRPQIGSMSYYAVTAVDEYGNESMLSEYATVTVDP